MQKFLKNTKGAVTVFVTLLLIPAILISGTAVDLARIHTARSIVQDANRLASNAVLSQYNALLYDLYGIFGVAETDPILARLLDEYIKVSVFGDLGQDKSLGTLQLFYGGNIEADDPDFADGKNLRNEEVILRQIEEYMKFRGPVIIVKDMLELLGSSTFREDSEVISDKLEVESAIAQIYAMYKELYEAITASDKCDQINGGIIGGTVGTVSSSLDLIRQQFVDLKTLYKAWEDADTQARKDEYAARYRATLDNIRARTVGGAVGSNWGNGRWQNTTNPQGLNRTIENAKNHAEAFKPRFDTVVAIARRIDGMHSQLKRKIDKFEQRLNSGGSNDELRIAFTEKTGSPPKSMIDRYRDILKWTDIEGMAAIYKNGGFRYIDDIVKPLLDSVIYQNHNSPSSASLTRTQLENISANSSFTLSSAITVENSRAAVFASYTRANITYNVPSGFLKFGDHPGRNKAFFEELSQMVNQTSAIPVKLYDGQGDTSGASPESSQRNLITELLEMVNTAYAGMANEPIGARYISTGVTSENASMDIHNIIEIIPQASNEPITNVISDPFGSLTRAAEYLLLLSYCTSMFSNYTTARPEIIGKSRGELDGINFPKSMREVPISPEVNYFFNSEWEYLYNGSENASTNLSAVSRLIFVVRLICNYITVFSVSEVSTIINNIRAAFALSPPLALVLGELARAAFVAAESAVDLVTLRSGHKVPLIKSGRTGEWICRPGAIARVLSDLAGNKAAADGNTNDKGLTYSNYLVFLLVAKALAESNSTLELAGRAADLIEWNVINYESGAFSDEGKMADALSEGNRFRLEDMKTDFSLTTTVDMNMLFLSMIFAQNFSDSRGIGMPQTVPVKVTDYRGY